MVAAALVVVLMAAGCGAAKDEGPGMRMEWDLSERHTLDEVAWQKENLDLYTTELKPVGSVRIRLPGDQTLEMREGLSGSIGLYRRSQGPEPLPGREGRILETVEVYTEPLTVDDAYGRALAHAKQFDLPRAPGRVASAPRGGGGGPDRSHKHNDPG